jgi:excisionase family DNA binding protein
MQVVTVTPDELSELVQQAVEKSVTKHVPGLLRRATKKPFLTVDELSQLTGWSRRTIQYLRDSRQLPFIQDGRRILFDTDEVELYLGSRKIPARGKR